MTAILIADDQALVRVGLHKILDAESEFTIVGEAADGEEAVELAQRLAPDVVLMDIRMPGMDGIEATRTLLDDGFAGAVVMLTSFSDRDRVTDALSAGAVGYLLKDSEPEAVLSAVRAAASGHAPIDPRVAGALLPSRTPSPAAARSRIRRRRAPNRPPRRAGRPCCRRMPSRSRNRMRRPAISPPSALSPTRPPRTSAAWSRCRASRGSSRRLAVS